ncbi:hypothetical protein K439DRAFT_1074548 [Ramaria rubella]|nr:hypothetical protein K439DRAFT_1074548 [Ramaria rubella]
MAGLSDFIYLAVTLIILGSAGLGIRFIVNRISDFKDTTKEKMKSRGYSVSHRGVEVQTGKRFNREDYVDATQRGFVKALGASSYGKVTNDGSGSASNKLPASGPTVHKTRSGLLHRKTDNK